jgi:hypothetical protein
MGGRAGSLLAFAGASMLRAWLSLWTGLAVGAVQDAHTALAREGPASPLPFR